VENLLTPEDLAQQLAMPVATLKYWRATGQGPEAVRIGRRVRYRPSAIETWLQKQRITADDAA